MHDNGLLAEYFSEWMELIVQRLPRLITAAVILLLSSVTTFSAEPAQRNVLLICVDDLRPELACFGQTYIHSPNIDQLAARGRAFYRHYVQAPTCGASRFTLLTGRYGGQDNGALFQRAAMMKKSPGSVPLSMPEWFRKHGYTTVSVGKVSHHPGGRGGPDWNDEDEIEMPGAWDRHLLPAGDWQHPRGWMHGLANGEIRGNATQMDVFQSLDGPDEIYPDGVSIPEALQQLQGLAAAEKPFFLAVGILRPHLPFGAPAKYLEPYIDSELPRIPHPEKPAGKTTWHGSGEFMKYNRWGRDPNRDADFAMQVRRHYAACVSYADEQVGRLITQLHECDAYDNTVIVLWGDHGWHLGEHAVWGKHTLFEESLRSPLIICDPTVREPGRPCHAVVETIDVFPTLCDLTKIPRAEHAQGASLLPLLQDPAGESRAAVAYHRNAKTIRTDKYRLIEHQDGTVELYNHSSVAGEAINVSASLPEVVQELRSQLAAQLQRQ